MYDHPLAVGLEFAADEDLMAQTEYLGITLVTTPSDLLRRVLGTLTADMNLEVDVESDVELPWVPQEELGLTETKFGRLGAQCCAGLVAPKLDVADPRRLRCGGDDRVRE